MPYQGFVDRFFRVVFRDQLLVSSSDKACAVLAPARFFVFSFLWERRGRFFYLSYLSLNIYQLAACQSRFAIGWR